MRRSRFCRSWASGGDSGRFSRKILQSKKDPGFHLFPIGRRVRDFVWEVLLQAKVIRERPLAGMAHALVFWAFCAFALVTLNHCATVFGLGFLDPAGRVGAFLFRFCGAVRGGLRGGHFRAVCAAIRCAAQVAGRGLVGIGPDCAADLRADGHVPGGVLCAGNGRCCTGAVVGAHAHAARVSAADSTHQAPASGAEPVHGLSSRGADSPRFLRSRR